MLRDSTFALPSNGGVRINAAASGLAFVSSSLRSSNNDGSFRFSAYRIKKGMFGTIVDFANDGSEAEVFGYYDAVISTASNLDEGLSFYVGESIYDLFEDYALLDEFLPYEVSVEPKGKKWVVAGGAAAGKIKIVDGAAVDSKESDNPSGLKLTFNAKAGTFSGSFKVYALDAKDKLKTFTATVSGVVVDGLGYGVATIKGLGSIAVMIE